MRRFLPDVNGRFTEVRGEVPELPVRSTDRVSLNELLKHKEARVACHYILTGEMPSQTPSEVECLALVRRMQAEGELPSVPLEPPAPEEPRILSPAECAERIRRMKTEGRLPTFEQFHRVVEDVLDEIDAERGNEPRERILPRRAKRIQ